MTERSFLHPVFSDLPESSVLRVADSSASANATNAKPDIFSMDDIGLARGAVPAEIWDWKRRHP